MAQHNWTQGFFRGVGLLIGLHVIFYILFTFGMKVGVVDDGWYTIGTTLFGLYQYVYVLPVMVLSIIKKRVPVLLGLLVSSVVSLLINLALLFGTA